MRVLLLLPFLAACAHAGARSREAPPPLYEMRSVDEDIDAPVPPTDVVAGIAVEQTSADEYAAFQRERVRLETHVNANCRRLSDSMKEHLPDVRMYDRAIVRY